MPRTLSRLSKDIAYMRQLGQCAYCLRFLDDAFEVDHLNECCTDDRWANLAACCGTCHNQKSRAYRLQRRDPEKAELLQRMLQLAVEQRAELWREFLLSDTTPQFPSWLTARVPPAALRVVESLAAPSLGDVPTVKSPFFS